ncbi:hypothetical protein BKX93_01585 [Chromobacterium vaccinii]|uniref:Uncharacterized protein n=2 Tax=Chromobacterium vaccinii TaxID=1108595 RepID=A0A1D9LCA5_9NEIS|nr:hypothetical protein BKX93_01585 [Chromobacterium vaccinii]
MQMLEVLMEGQPPEYARSKLLLHTQIESKALANEGFDGLLFQYSDMCKSLMEDPDSRMHYWLEKK